MEQNQNPSPNKKPGDDKRPKSNMWVTLIVTVAIVLLISSLYNAIVGSQYTKKTYSDFLQAMENGELAEVCPYASGRPVIIPDFLAALISGV